MIICSPYDVETNFDVVNSLLSITKKEVIRYSRLLNFSISSGLSKDQFIRKYSEALHSNPRHWLRQLTRYEVELVARMVSFNAVQPLEVPATLFPLNLLEFGVVVRIDSDCRKVMTLKMADSLRLAIGDIAEQLLNDPIQQQHWTIESCCMGLTNLYGVLKIADIIEHTCRYLPNIKELEVIQVLSISAYIQNNGKDKNGLLHSGIIYDCASILKNQRNGVVREKQKLFTLEEILDASNFLIPEKKPYAFSTLRQQLLEIGVLTSQEVDYKIAFMWQLSQFNYNLLEITQETLHLESLSVDKLSKLLEELTTFCNTRPQWLLHGYTADEAHALTTRTSKTNKRTTDMDIFLGKTPVTTPVQRSTSKVGRNEPCPCGSGKKYKQCCGKN